MIVRVLSGLFFTEIGVKERYIGYLNYLGLPWNLKFLWAPLLDGWFSKRAWQVALQLLLGVCTCLVGMLSYFAAGMADQSTYLQIIAVMFIVMAFLSATNDTAIDGFYLEALPSRRDQAAFSGYRVLAYRLAMVFVRSGIVAFVAWMGYGMGGSDKWSAWSAGFLLCGVTLLLVGGLHYVYLPMVTHEPAEAGGSDSRLDKARRMFVEGFTSYVQQPSVGLVLAFIVLYKMGDEIMFSMVTPFMRRELAITTEQYAWIGGIVGAAGAILGAMAGGYWIKRVGLKRALWPLTLIMNLNIWLFVWLSVTKPDPATWQGISVIAAIHGVEQIAAGLGSAALLVYLLTTCSQQYKATHYAVGSAIMSIPATFLGGNAGLFVERYGYTWLYVVAFVASIPGMMLIPFVPIREE
jgi:PAT family beta-lactamase induction signal transducer AmpG